MGIHKRKKRRMQKFEDVPMTPMIDVVFQLLIFFLTTFKDPPKEAEIEAMRPQATASTPSESDPNILKVFVYTKADPKAKMAPVYTLEQQGANGMNTLDDIEGFLAETADVDPESTIVLTALVDSYHGDLMAVLDLCAKYKLKNISVMSGQGN